MGGRDAHGPGARHHAGRGHADRLPRLREPGLGGKIGLDATNKWPPETRRDWGKEIRMSDAVVEKVDRMWKELGLPGSGRRIWR